MVKYPTRATPADGDSASPQPTVAVEPDQPTEQAPAARVTGEDPDTRTAAIEVTGLPGQKAPLRFTLPMPVAPGHLDDLAAGVQRLWQRPEDRAELLAQQPA